jgi:5-methylcytosine-specific restriction endonuclease McrA
MAADPRHTYPYRLFAQQVRREEHTCWLCGHPIDMSLPYRDPRTGRVNVWCWSLDHVVPVDHRPDLALVRGNARGAHFRCNSARGKRQPSVRAPIAPLITTRRW